MQLFNSFKKTGKQYAVEKQGSLASTLQAEQPATENTAVEMDQKGIAMVRCDPSTILRSMDSTNRRPRLQHNSSLARPNESMPSALSMLPTIPAGPDFPDLSKPTLGRTGNMADNQATFSPLQGTARHQTMMRQQSRRLSRHLSMQPSMTGTVAQKSRLGEAGSMFQQGQGAKCMLTELENLSMDMHSQWLDAFSACPVPSLVISTVGEPQVLVVNSACVTSLGRDASKLGSSSLADLIGSQKSLDCAKAAEAGFEFIAPDCSVQVGRAMQCSALFIPITDMCTSERPQCYLVLLIDSFAQPLCSSAVESVPDHAAVREGTAASHVGWRKGMFSKGHEGGNTEHYNQAVGIVSGFAEAAQRRLKGSSLGTLTPSQFDVGGWIGHFEKLLTLSST